MGPGKIHLQKRLKRIFSHQSRLISESLLHRASLQRMRDVGIISNAQFSTKKSEGIQRNRELQPMWKNKINPQKPILKKHSSQTYWTKSLNHCLKYDQWAKGEHEQKTKQYQENNTWTKWGYKQNKRIIFKKNLTDIWGWKTQYLNWKIH